MCHNSSVVCDIILKPGAQLQFNSESSYFIHRFHCIQVLTVAEMGNRLATVDMSQKLGGGLFPSWGNTMWPGPRPTFVPSGILIHPAIWPQQTWAEKGGLCPLEGVELGPHLT